MCGAHLTHARCIPVSNKLFKRFSAPAAPTVPGRLTRLFGFVGLAATGFNYFCALAFIVALTAATGRVAAAWYRAPKTDAPLMWFVAAVWRDLCSSIPVLASLVYVGLAIVLFLSRFRERLPHRWLVGVLATAALLVWISAISFAEFSIQRGASPVWHDLAGGLDSSFMASAVANFFYPRYLIPGFGVWGLVAGGLVFYARHLARRRGPQSRIGFLCGFAAAAILFVEATHPIYAPRFPFPAALTNAEGVTDPFGRFLDSVTVALTGASTEPRDILKAVVLPSQIEAEGAALQGLSWRSDAGDCAAHPFASALDAPPVGVGIALQRLSQSLFQNGIGEDLLVFELSLESFRGDDLAALNSAAPAQLAPFINSLYANAGTGEESVIAATKFWQGGVRTSQGVASFTCGLGTFPYGISLVRDLGALPLRCLSDVLVDAGFSPLFAYGSHLSFDNMGVFLRYHGFGAMLTEETLPKDLPKGEWHAVSDLALVDQALKEVARQPAHSMYTLLMTLSNHSPFRPPEDLPGKVSARVKEVLQKNRSLAQPEDFARLTTYSYTDFAVQTFFERLHELGLDKRSIVVLHADHATGERFVWPMANGADNETEEAKGRIPFAMVFPRALVDRAREPDELRKLIRNANEVMNHAPASLNDVPRWLLSLLADHPGMKSIPQPWRWHSLGGMTSSPTFATKLPQQPRLIGINGVNEYFLLDQNGHAAGQVEDVNVLTSESEVFTATRSLFPAAALWSSFMRGYAQRCPAVSGIRRAGRLDGAP